MRLLRAASDVRYAARTSRTVCASRRGSFLAHVRASAFLSQIRSAGRCTDVETMSMSHRWVEADFEAIFREHYPRIVRVIRRVLQRDSEAEEVCADVFLRLYNKGPEVAAGGLVGGWLYRTATHASIDVLRANRRRGLEEELDGNESFWPMAMPRVRLPICCGKNTSPKYAVCWRS